MITPRHHRPRSGASRSGFTLVELLVAITVIGILVGMLLVAVIPVMTRAKETAILMEMKQIEQQIELFKTQNGFYPPSWVNIRTNDSTFAANSDIQCANELLRYIGAYAKNNREGVGTPGSRPIDVWWRRVGNKIDHTKGQDLVFWLSGLCKNKQFPLSNGNGFAFNGDNVERDVLYEFKDQQLVKVDYAADMASVAGYDQQASSDAPFLYIDNSSYGNDVGGFDGYHVLNVIGTPTRVYENPKSFQLICWGMDKDPGTTSQWARQTAPTYDGLVDLAGPASADNLCNFCEGRLERIMMGTLESSAVK